jgi:hypothetical protein
MPRTAGSARSSRQANLLPSNLRATAGFDLREDRARAARSGHRGRGRPVGLRADTEEKTLRGELRRSISETLTGSLGAGHSESATGSDWYSLANVPAQGGGLRRPLFLRPDFPGTATFPYNLADRKRDRSRPPWTGWRPERLQLQFVGEGSHDSYHPPSENGLAQRGGGGPEPRASYALGVSAGS